VKANFVIGNTKTGSLQLYLKVLCNFVDLAYFCSSLSLTESSGLESGFFFSTKENMLLFSFVSTLFIVLCLYVCFFNWFVRPRSYRLNCNAQSRLLDVRMLWSVLFSSHVYANSILEVWNPSLSGRRVICSLCFLNKLGLFSTWEHSAFLFLPLSRNS
jgi:hypothetical protein